MTNKQLDRAKTIEEEIRYNKARLKTVKAYIKNYKGSSKYGLKTDQTLLIGEIIYPNDSEMNVLLILMKNRLESRIVELEKEFEEL